MTAIKYLEGGVWKTLTMPSAVHVGPSAPDPTVKQLWVDTDESSLGEQCYLHCHRVASQTIGTSNWTSIIFTNIAEQVGAGAPTLNVGNGYVTINETGVYVLTFNFYWADNATGRRFGSINHMNDGTGSTFNREIARWTGIPGNNNPGAPVTRVRRLTQGQVVRASVFQDSGGNLDVIAAQSPEFPSFTIARTGP